MATNRALSSFPMLSEHLTAVRRRYLDYIAHRGNPWTVGAPLEMPPPLADAMRTHYATEPRGLEFIAQLREAGSPDVCSMCGSLKAGTLDHVLPKERFPEFAVFAPNLVPACDCNSLRGTRYKGSEEGSRVLHPYFDDFMRTRLVNVQLSGNLNRPLAAVRIIEHGLPKEDIDAIQFHVDAVLNRSSLLIWASEKWATLCRDPESVLLTLPDGGVTAEDVRTALTVRLRGADREHKTPNNWYSMVFHGVLASEGAVVHILRCLETAREGGAALL
ncbi:hypothetical protein [Burkholderia sp. WP9]|uniref:hypothetical protein n=1 Tax=Burkholderia sp. WP9 TaxID=1500263 RepID=UPI00115FA04E|nr:hypothetical protein [Burkholderia sp. WP9]